MTSGVVGIDPSLTGTGIAYPGGHCTIKTTAAQPDGERLSAIYHGVLSLVDTASTRLVVIEDLPVHGKGAGLTGMAQGVVRLALHVRHVPFVEVPPATLKKYATNNGNASKADMRVELFMRAGLNLRDDNQVDAWWLMAIGHSLLDEPIVALPAAHVRALAKLKLPIEVN